MTNLTRPELLVVAFGKGIGAAVTAHGFKMGVFYVISRTCRTLSRKALPGLIRTE